MTLTPMNRTSLPRPPRRVGSPSHGLSAARQTSVAVDVRRLKLDPNANEWSLLTSTATGKWLFFDGLPSPDPNAKEWSLLTSTATIDRSSFNGLLIRAALLLLIPLFLSCGNPAGSVPNPSVDSQVVSLGQIEVSARLVEIPDGAVFQRDLYDYATILKYEVVTVHRGALGKSAPFYVAHYNPWKARAEAADPRARAGRHASTCLIRTSPMAS